jgi:anti-anti-sigma factor
LDLTLNTRQQDDVIIIDAVGKIIRGEAVDSFRSTVADLVQSGKTKILLNLKDVEFIDSAGVGVLVAAVTQVRCNSCETEYSNLMTNKCPECGAAAEDGEINVNVENGAWAPPWGSFKLLFPNKKIEDLLRVTKLYEAFRIYHDETVAVQSF